MKINSFCTQQLLEEHKLTEGGGYDGKRKPRHVETFATWFLSLRFKRRWVFKQLPTDSFKENISSSFPATL